MRSPNSRAWAALAVAGLLTASSAHAQEPLAPPKEQPPQPLIAADAPAGPCGMLDDEDGHAVGPSRWFLQAESLLWHRDVPRVNVGTDVGANIASPGDDRLINTKEDLDFDFKGGLRITVGRQLAPDTSIEVSYLGVPDWNTSTLIQSRLTAGNAGFILSGTLRLLDLNGDGNPDIIVGGFNGLFPFDLARSYHLSYSSDLHSGEINVRRWLWTHDRLAASLLAGVRYLRVDEDFALTAAGTAAPLPGADTPLVGQYSINTQNDLFGVQIGGDVVYEVGDRLNLLGTGKIGGYLNLADRESTISNGILLGDGAFYLNERANDEGLAGVLELGIHAIWRCTPCITIGVGYNAMFISGLALAPRQLDFTLFRSPTANGLPSFRNSPDLVNSGTTFFHGPSAGVAFTW